MEEKSIWRQKSGTASNSAYLLGTKSGRVTALSNRTITHPLLCPIARQALCSPREKSIFHLTSHKRVNGPSCRAEVRKTAC